MDINWYKTKEMVLCTKTAFISDLCVNLLPPRTGFDDKLRTDSQYPPNSKNCQISKKVPFNVCPQPLSA